ncbi:MAG: PD-(D/E)XK nuclease family protein [Tepidisphaerales bacterium]
MAVRLVVGRAGSGKTALCHREIFALLRDEPLGRPVYWVVPRQMTFSTERWLACGSGLAASARCRVVSFERLAEVVLAEHPGPVRAVMSPFARRAVVAHLLRRLAPELAYFGPSADWPGLAGELINLLDEFNRDGVLGDSDEDPLSDAINRLDPEERLWKKLSDVRRLRDAYREFLGSGRMDAHGRMRHVLNHAGRCSAFRGARFYIDGFLEFMDFERRMVGRLCQTAAATGGEVVVTLLVPPTSPLVTRPHLLPDDHSLFHRVELTYRELRLMLHELGVTATVERLDGSVRFCDGTLASMERWMAGEVAASGASAVEPSATSPRDGPAADVPAGASGGSAASARGAVSVNAGRTPGDAGGLEMFTASTPASEVEQVAARIRRLTFASPGWPSPRYRFRDIAVLARDLRPYERHIARHFETMGIPFFVDQRVVATAHPLVRVVRTLLLVAREGLTTEAVLALARSGRLPGATAEAVSELGRWCVERQPGDDAWTALHRTYANAPPLFVALRERVAPHLQRWAEAWAGKLEVNAACRELMSLVQQLDIQIRADDEEDLRVHDAVFGDGGLLEELADVLAGESVSREAFADTLSAALDGLDLGLVPPTVDQVLVGSAERTRVGAARVVFVLGLADGMFPARPADSALLPDAERRQLEAAGMGLRASVRAQARDERLVAYMALTRASEKLVVSRPLASEEGTPIAASPLWEAIAAKFGAAERADRPAANGVAEPPRTGHVHPVLAAGSWPAMVSAVTAWASQGAPPHDTLSAAAYDALRGACRDNPHAQAAVRTLWPSLQRESIDLTLSAAVVERLYGGRDAIELTCDAMSTFAECPFKYFVEEVLRPRSSRRTTVKPWVLGRVIRRTYEAALRALMNSRGPDPRTDFNAVLETMERWSATTAEAQRRELVRWLSDDGSDSLERLPPEGRYLVRQASDLTRRLLAAEVAVQRRTRFRPKDLYARFGRGGRLPPLELKLDDGRLLHVGGVIHRLDMDPAFSVLLCEIMSGSTSRHPLPGMYHGLHTPLLGALLLVDQLIRSQHPGAGAAVAGVVSLPILPRWETVERVSKYVEKKNCDLEIQLAERRKARGVVLVDSLPSLDERLAPNSTSPMFQVSVTTGGAVHSRGDHLSAEGLERLIERGRSVLSQLAGQLLRGDITPRPYRLGDASPCPSCPHRAVCRFNPRGGGSYHELRPRKMAEIKQALEADTPGGEPSAGSAMKEL